MAATKEDTREEEDEDDDVEDLVSAINYNTITSMAALKEMLGTDSRTNHEDVSWFQHYFLRHVNRLPSRSQYAGRRLSECKEEDEGQDGEQKIESAVKKVEEPVKVRKMTIKRSGRSEPTSPSYSVPSSPRKAQSQETLPMSPKLNRGTSPHFDKHFFEAGLIEIKSQASSTSTLDYDSNDEVWVKRTDSYESDCRKRRKELGSQPLAALSADDSEGSSKGSHRPRSDTWDQSRGRGSRPSSVHSSISQSSSKSSSKATTPVSESCSRDRRSSEDETPLQNNANHRKAHSRTPAPSPPRRSGGLFFDAFRPRSKSDATSKTIVATTRKSNNIISQMKNVVQCSLMSPTSSGRSSASGSSSSTEIDVNHVNRYQPRNEPEMTTSGGRRYRSTSTSDASGSSRPRSDSINSRGAVSKVIDLFRYRSNSAVSAEDKRRAKAAAYHQHNTLSHGALLRRSSLDPDRRRLSLGPTIPHRGSDVGLDPNHAAILFRDSRGLPVADPFLEKVNISDLEEDECQIFVKFFKFHKCYDLIPTSAKLVVFDTQLLVKKAFFALVDNGVRAAPLWDSIKQEYVGMLTITDFIKILQKYYTSASVAMDELEEHKLQTWKEELPDQTNEMISIGPDVSLYEAISVLIHNRIHRLPVIDPDTGNVLYILTHKRILRFLFLYINDLPRPTYMNKSLNDLKIGTYENVETVSEETTIISALKKFVERRVSALPMVDDTNRLVDIFAKFDVINLAAERTYNNLDITLKQANEHRNEWFEGVHRCYLNDTLYSCLEKIVRAEVHRLVVVDDDEKVIGIISLSDLLVFLVLRPCNNNEKFRKSSYSSVTDSVDDDQESVTDSIAKLSVSSATIQPMITATISSSSQLMTSSNDQNNIWREVTVSGGE